ncbi:hypothetical protein QQP08_024053 [Theobroma cacao]|nr:hypothetical protein QQP08_024053 [Theobroma cacao]
MLNIPFDRAVAQDFHNKEEARQEDEAKQAHPSLDSDAHRQYHQVFSFLSFTLANYGIMQSAGTGVVRSSDSEFAVEDNDDTELMLQ